MSRVPRVAVVIPRFAPIFGGAENQAALLNQHLLSGGRARIPFVVTKRITRSLPRDEPMGGTRVRRVGLPGVGRWSDYVFFAAVLLFLLRHRREYDLIHCHGSSVIGAVAAVAGRILGRPVVIKLSTRGELGGTGARSAIARRVQRAIARVSLRYGHVVALSGEGEREIRQAGGTDYSVIPNGVDTARFHPPDAGARRAARESLGWGGDEVVLLFTGRFVRAKGIDTLLAGFRDAAGREPRLRLLLVGSAALQHDPMGELVAREVERSGGAIRRVDAVPDVRRFLHAADLFVFPSRREGLSNSVLEALAAGVALVLSDIDPHVELAARHPDAPIELFQRGSPEALAAAVRRTVDRLASRPLEPGGLTPLGEPYRIESVAERYGALYRRLLEGG